MRRPALLAAVLFAGLMALAFSPQPEAASAPPRATLDRLRAGGVLRVGYRTDARPLSFRDENGRASGYSVALCQEIVNAVKRERGLGGITVDWMPATVSDRFDALRDGRLDLLCGSSTITLARREQVSFSIPIFAGGIGAVMGANAAETLRVVLAGQAQTFQPVWRASAAQALEGRTFAAVRGTTGDAWLTERIANREVVAGLSRVDGYGAGLQLVADGAADALFGERAVIFEMARRHPQAAQFVIVDRFFTLEPLALGLPRGDEDFRLLVDRTLSRMYTSGAIDAVYSAWFGEPTTTARTFFALSAIPQ